MKLERFGKYLILDHLVDGGMAKICRAKFLGEQANKIVAIKMVQGQFSKDPSFVQMFEDELKITFGLLHPNIVQVSDYGMVNDQLYSAMEYIDGANLKQYLDRLKEKNFVFPVEISTYIISQVCQGLHYAHTFTDKLTGKPFNIIHRDISPHNIMLTFDGSVKVIDFGIAKAETNSEATRAGTIKGKLSYLAPEYLEGLELDARYDLFAVGITLWEMLCSQKLFSAPNDLAVLKHIQACNVPAPSSINPNVPKELDAIVMKALSKDRNQRFDDMDQFNRALVRFLYANYPEFNSTDLSYFAKQLFKDEIEQDRKKFVEYGKIDVTPYIEQMEGGSQAEAKAPVFGADGIDLDLSKNVEMSITQSMLAPKIPQKTAAISRKPISRQTRRSIVKIDPSEAQKSKKENNKKSKFYIYAACLLLACLGVYEKLDFKNILSEGVDRQVANTQSIYGEIGIINYDNNVEVYVNDESVEVKGINIQVPLDQELTIRVSKKGYSEQVFDGLILTKDKSFKQIELKSFRRELIGELFVSDSFTPGSKIVFEVAGRVRSISLPVSGERVPVGEYQAKIRNDLLDTEKEIKFVIEENKKTFL